jgi:hypothetical protein
MEIVKYENVYLQDYQSVPEVRIGLASYFQYYSKRPHQALLQNTLRGALCAMNAGSRAPAHTGEPPCFLLPLDR